MNRSHFWIRLNRNEGALIRALGLVARRGFEITSLASNLTDDQTQLAVRMTVCGPRRSATLANQLRRLVDVAKLAYEEELSEPAARSSSESS